MENKTLDSSTCHPMPFSLQREEERRIWDARPVYGLVSTDTPGRNVKPPSATTCSPG